MSLQAAKPTYEMQLKNEFSSILERAFYEALKAQDSGEENAFNSLPAEVSPAAKKVREEMDKKFKNAAKKFSQEASGDMAKAVAEKTYNFIKEMMINVDNAPVPPSVVSPTGSCTGTLTILPTNFQIM